MAISIKLDKSGIKKIQNELEYSLKRQMIARGSTELRKDSEVFLKIVLDKRNETGKDTIVGSVDMFSSIPNIRMNIYNIMDDLKLHNCISTQSNICVSGEVEIILTMDGIDYFKEKGSMLEREVQKNMNKGLYEGVRSFFVFVCNRQNIGLRSAILIGEYPRKRNENGKIVEVVGYTQQEIIFSQKYLEPLEDEKKIKKVPNSRLFSTKELFQMFLEQSAEGTAIVNGSSIHPSFKYRNLIDLEQSLHITAAFEYYVRTLLPEISSDETIEFLNDMQVLVEEYIKTVTGKKKKKAKDFKKSLRPQISLEEKIMKVYEGYSNWLPLKTVLSEWFGEDISDLAKAANLWRNELAHEKREYQPDIKTIDAVRFVEHVNYCIILRYAGYADEQIKEIVSDVLIR